MSLRFNSCGNVDCTCSNHTKAPEYSMSDQRRANAKPLSKLAPSNSKSEDTTLPSGSIHEPLSSNPSPSEGLKAFMPPQDTSLDDELMKILGSSINFTGLADDWYIKHLGDVKQINRLIEQTEINLLRDTADGFESELLPEFERGGRGISVEQESWKSFSNFLDDMGIQPKGLQLERIDNDRGYSRSNCKWATKSEQMKNRRKFTRSRV